MKRLSALILTFSMLIGTLAVGVFAVDEEVLVSEEIILESSDVSIPNQEDEGQNSEYIYYTDLFYAYPMYLSEDKYFKTYSNNIENVYNTVNNAYQNSSLIVGTGLEHALDTITSPTDMAKLITDTLGLTDFSYNDALDAANDEFVRNILSESTARSVEKAFGETANVNDKFNKILAYFNKLELESANGSILYSAEYYVQKAFDHLHDEGVFSFVSEQTIAKLWTEINDSDFALSDCFTLAKTEIDIAKALVTSIMMEDERLAIVDQIIATQKSDTILKQGMVRLKNQLHGNFIDYFIKSYLRDKLADKVFEAIDEIVIDVVTGNELSAIIEVVKNALDLVVDIPSYGDVLKWQVLICYSNDLAGVIPDVAKTFTQGPFLSDKILEYESMFTAYAAINKAAMATTEKIADMLELDPFGAAYEVLTEAINNGIENVTIKSGLVAVSIPATTSSSELYAIMLGNKILTTSSGGIFTVGKKIEVSNGLTTVTVPIQANLLSSVMQGCISESQQTIDNFKFSYAEKSIYEEHIKSVKTIIFNTPIEERNITRDIEYYIDGNTKLRMQSDEVEKGSIYTFNNSLLGNVNVSGNVSITFPIEISGNFSCSTSAKSDIRITNCATLKIKGNLEFCTRCPNWLYKGDSYIRVDEKSKLEVGGDFLLQGSDASGHGHYANLYINGTIIVDGNLTTNYSAYRIFSTTDTGYFKIGKNVKLCVWGYADKNYGEFSAGTMEIGGNYDADAKSLKYTGSSLVVFSGLEEQNVANLITNCLTIKNKSGIKYLSNIYVNSLFDTENNPINNNGFYTIVSNTTQYIQGYNYYNIKLQSNIVLDKSIKTTLFTNGYQLTIPKEEIVEIDGTVYVNASQLIVNGKLRVTGKIDVAKNASVVNYGNTVTNSVYLQTMNYYAGRNSITNHGYFEVLSNFESCADTYANSKTGYRIIQNTSNSEFVVGGNFLAQTHDVCDSITNGIVRFNGNSYQYVKNLKAPTIVIDNESTSGVTFATKISPRVLFDHKGNNFTLYNNGSGSTFVDYDSDGLKDNVDPKPTVGNPCTLYFVSGDTECGTVSIDKVDTYGGTSVTVKATPTAKYEFVKWIDSAGITVGANTELTIVAKGNRTYTAVFAKREYTITVQCDGGSITAPSSAVVDSEVTVSVNENAGYVYTNGSLTYNGIEIVDCTFIMPNENIILSAAFVRNENYFTLLSKINEAKECLSGNYTAQSLAILESKIVEAELALCNDIPGAASVEYCLALQNAMDNLNEGVGDANGDSVINIIDITLVAQYIAQRGVAGSFDLSECFFDAMDINVDGVIDQIDLNQCSALVSGWVSYYIDAELLSVEYNINDARLGVLPVVANVQNNSYKNITSLIFSVTDDKGAVVIAEEKKVDVLAKSSAKLLIDFIIPANCENELYTLKVVPAECGDYNNSNNCAGITLAHEHEPSDEWIYISMPVGDVSGHKSRKCSKCGRGYEMAEVKPLAIKNIAPGNVGKFGVRFAVDSELFDMVGYSSPKVKIVLNSVETIIRNFSETDGVRYFTYGGVSLEDKDAVLEVTLSAELNGQTINSKVYTYVIDALVCEDETHDCEWVEEILAGVGVPGEKHGICSCGCLRFEETPPLEIGETVEGAKAQFNLVASEVAEDGTFTVGIYAEDFSEFGWVSFGGALSWDSDSVEPVINVVNDTECFGNILYLYNYCEDVGASLLGSYVLERQSRNIKAVRIPLSDAAYVIGFGSSSFLPTVWFDELAMQDLYEALYGTEYDYSNGFKMGEVTFKLKDGADSGWVKIKPDYDMSSCLIATDDTGSFENAYDNVLPNKIIVSK